MTRVTKFIFAIIFISGCNNIPYTTIIPIVKSGIQGPEKIIIDQEFIESRKFSFIKAKFGRKSEALLTLVSVENGVYKWISADNVKIYTLNGKITKLENFDTLNFEATYKQPPFYSNFGYYDLFFKTPKTFVTQTYSVTTYHQKEIFFDKKIVEEVDTSGFKWRYKNQYFYLNNKPIKTEQYIYPRAPKLILEFYYK